MKETETLLRFLRSTTNLSVFCWDGTEHAMVEKEQKDCFSKQAQPLLTAQGLRMVLECMQPAFLYEVEDLIGIHYLSFLFQSNPIVIGPFVSEEWNDSAADTRLTGAGIPASCLIPYKLYYCSYPLLDKHTIIQLVTGAITALCPDIPPYTYQKFSGIQNHQQQACCHNLEISDFDSAVHRYELENEFLSRIAEGQTGLALEAWHRLSKIPSADALFLDGLRGLTTNASILRTLIRKEAERSGVHPAVVDAISLAYAQKMYSARSAKELQQMIPAMIQEFCEAVHHSHVSHYSPPIARVSAYLRLHVSSPPDMNRLAELAKCSASHLGRRFKEETGLTIAQYLAKERCIKAAAMLIHTDLPVHEISAYVGYLDNNYFVKIFKKFMQVTPTAYRRKFHGHTPC